MTKATCKQKVYWGLTVSEGVSMNILGRAWKQAGLLNPGTRAESSRTETTTTMGKGLTENGMVILNIKAQRHKATPPSSSQTVPPTENL